MKDTHKSGFLLIKADCLNNEIYDIQSSSESYTPDLP